MRVSVRFSLLKAIVKVAKIIVIATLFEIVKVVTKIVVIVIVIVFMTSIMTFIMTFIIIIIIFFFFRADPRR